MAYRGNSVCVDCSLGYYLNVNDNRSVKATTGRTGSSYGAHLKTSEKAGRNIKDKANESNKMDKNYKSLTRQKTK